MHDLATDQWRKQCGKPYHDEQPSSEEIVVCQQLLPGLMHGIVKKAELEPETEDKPEEPVLEEGNGW